MLVRDALSGLARQPGRLELGYVRGRAVEDVQFLEPKLHALGCRVAELRVNQRRGAGASGVVLDECARAKVAQAESPGQWSLSVCDTARDSTAHGARNVSARRVAPRESGAPRR